MTSEAGGGRSRRDLESVSRVCDDPLGDRGGI